MKNRLLHIYCGDGKGKTTAATGLAVRAAGSGMRVLFARFLKKPRMLAAGISYESSHREGKDSSEKRRYSGQ